MLGARPLAEVGVCPEDMWYATVPIYTGQALGTPLRRVTTYVLVHAFQKGGLMVDGCR